ncbi:hypothetical protein [Streptomyces sp. NPDC088246]|uniref:hypothetical protein n=1 Tax=Streptomyces sp. NPDC088246 TaxID=3365842 RepID=UPI00382E8A19
MIVPQQTSVGKVEASILGSRPLSPASRTRRRGDLFGAISEPKHRGAALRVAGAIEDSGDPLVESIVREQRGVLVLYPLAEEEPPRLSSGGAIDPGAVVMAFSLVAPTSPNARQRSLVRLRAIDSSKSNFAVIDREEGGA